MMKCRLQLPAFQPLPLPSTLFASMTNQLSTQGHTDSLLSPVPGPGLGLAFTSLYHSCKQRTLVPQVKQGFVLKCRFVHLRWKKMPQKKCGSNTVAFKCQQQREREALATWQGANKKKYTFFTTSWFWLLTNFSEETKKPCKPRLHTWRTREGTEADLEIQGTSKILCYVTPRALLLLNETS